MGLDGIFPVQLIKPGKDNRYLMPFSGIKLKPCIVLPFDEPMKVPYNSEEGLTDERVFEEWVKTGCGANAYTVMPRVGKYKGGERNYDSIVSLRMKGIPEGAANAEREAIRKNGSA